LREYRQFGLKVPDEVRRATNEYRADMDTVGRFIEDACVKGSADVRTPASKLYEAYVSWCRDNEETTKNQKGFGTGLRNHGFSNRPTKTGVVWEGIGLLGE
jgi:putative DNA primase/helicase